MPIRNTLQIIMLACSTCTARDGLRRQTVPDAPQPLGTMCRMRRVKRPVAASTTT